MKGVVPGLIAIFWGVHLGPRLNVVIGETIEEFYTCASNTVWRPLGQRRMVARPE